MWLDDALFEQVISTTPLVSIDLIVEDSSGRVLLGQRLNRPAQGFWFVPGGRIRKDEKIADAFARLSLDEVGRSIGIEQARFLGVYQHLYRDTVFGENNSTHYVVLAFSINLDVDSGGDMPTLQHGAYRWFDVNDLLIHPQVHDNTKDYFRPATCYGKP